MATDEDKSTLGERRPEGRDPKDVDGLLTVDQATDPPSGTQYGHDETDTLSVEHRQQSPEHVVVPAQNGITAADTN